nr:MAG TPA: hypothetical protein [Caudoviricetes sp.]
MTRKRYVKLLMACGTGRSQAIRNARYVQAYRASYRGDLVCWLSLSFAAMPWAQTDEQRSVLRRRAAILKRALYGEVAHE